MDMTSRRTIGLSVFHRMHAGSHLIALYRARNLRKTFPRISDSKQIIIHSDRDTQYSSKAFRDALARYGILQIISGVGNNYNNAPMESHWARLKTLLAFTITFCYPDEVARKIYGYLRAHYNSKRRHSGIGNVTPVEIEGRYFRSILSSSRNQEKGEDQFPFRDLGRHCAC